MGMYVVQGAYGADGKTTQSLDAGPARGAFSVTPNDSTDLSTYVRAIYIGGDGNMKIDTLNGETVTFSGLVAGSVLSVGARRIYSTDTTATNIVGLY